MFLTVHDIGSNHSSWVSFVSHDAMSAVKERAAFLHVVVPGQEAGAVDLKQDFSFPSMEVGP